MTPGSNRSLTSSRKGIDRNCCCRLHRPLKYRLESICLFSEMKPKNLQQEKPNVRTRPKYYLKDRTRMEQQDPKSDANAEGTERRVRELTSKWFLETQLPLMATGGLLPSWFLGFITRKDAEEILREKDLGCFLIRLSDKAIGYILSYKGRDRCRHFVINQSESGQLVICGDTASHNTVRDLVDYYKNSPIEPFGEYLTSSCLETLNENLYDNIQVSPKLRPLGSGQALKNMQQQQQTTLTSDQQLEQPLKSNRTLELKVASPRRSRLLEPGPMDHVLYAHLEKQSPRQKHKAQTSQDTLPRAGRADQWHTTVRNVGRCSSTMEPQSLHSDLNLLSNRSRSPLLMNHIYDGKHSHTLSTPPGTPPKLSPKPVRQLTGYVSLLDTMELSSRASSSHSLNHMDESAVYHLAGRPGSPHSTSINTRSPVREQNTNSVYAEILCEAPPGCLSADSTYEMIPGTRELVDSRHHKTLEDGKSKHNHTSWGLKNHKWKWLFPEVKKK